MSTPKTFPKYPIYIPSKGRANPKHSLTARTLAKDDIPFYVVVEPQTYDAYCKIDFIGPDKLLVLPFSDLGMGAIPARNWIMDHAVASGAERHWQLDDNMRDFYRQIRGTRIRVHGGVALRVCEDLSDRYENVGLSGLTYHFFQVPQIPSPVFLNCHIYSCTLVNNAIPYRWRTRYNDDTDLCLQVLSGGWCTILVNAFSVGKMRTETSPGGMRSMYDEDGRLKMARSLERDWPYIVDVRRRFGRPQHVVRAGWKHFNTPLQLKPTVKLDELPPVDEYGLTLKENTPLQSHTLRKTLGEWLDDKG